MESSKFIKQLKLWRAQFLEKRQVPSRDVLYQLIADRWQGTNKELLAMPIYNQIQDQIWLMMQVEMIHQQEQSNEFAHKLRESKSVRSLWAGQPTIQRAYGQYLVPEHCETYVVGDLHSDPGSLRAVIEASQLFENLANGEDKPGVQLVFMGDYVDRGEGHLEILDLLLTLKYLFPQHIVLLRGNHDGGHMENNGNVKTPYGIPEKDDPLSYFPPYIRALENSNFEILEPILHHYLNFFDGLAMVAYIRKDQRIYMACHGGIIRPQVLNRCLTEHEAFEKIDELAVAEPHLLLPKSDWYTHIPDLRSLTQADAFDPAHRSRVQQLFWSDPTEKLENMRWHLGRFKFTEDHFKAYRTHLDFDVLLRGHEVVKDGLRSFFEGSLYTVYSTGAHLKNGLNVISAYKEVSPCIVKLTGAGVEKIWI